MQSTTLVALMRIEKRPAAASARFRFIEARPDEPLQLPRLRSHDVVFVRGRHRETEHAGMALSKR